MAFLLFAVAVLSVFVFSIIIIVKKKQINYKLSTNNGAFILKYFPKNFKDWEVMEDAHAEIPTTGNETVQDMAAPGICEGYLLKRRRWPLKGWHKVRNHN